MIAFENLNGQRIVVALVSGLELRVPVRTHRLAWQMVTRHGAGNTRI